jgi:hypothetical protein
MSKRPVIDPGTPTGEILKVVESGGVMLESESRERYVFLPLDDDVIDLPLEHSPAFHARCKQIRKRVGSGQFRTREEVRRRRAGE